MSELSDGTWWAVKARGAIERGFLTYQKAADWAIVQADMIADSSVPFEIWREYYADGRRIEQGLVSTIRFYRRVN